ncbi:MAG: anhydro-N-acetylmuramic acid kinase [Planctomycetota bacterium]|nr:anhydro-N-acetylmuramic acid kinase [Planctomycetota bacterium]
MTQPHATRRPEPDTRLVVGCMTGTSLDGLDAALVAITGNGLDLRATLVGSLSTGLGDLRQVLRQMASGAALGPLAYLLAARKLGELHADAVEALCRREGARTIDLVVAHGQTIWHAPNNRETAAGVSWQLFDPWPIVRRLRVPVVYDLRQADLIAGGQGAPITPLADWILFRSPQRARFVVNLGGICNVTHLPAGGSPSSVGGGDIGPCNLLIDGVVRLLHPDKRFDEDGQLAAVGTPNPRLAEIVRRTSPFFARPWPRSTGREDFTDVWVASVVEEGRGTIAADDLVASAVDAVAALIAGAAKEAGGASGSIELILAGGGARNPVLVARIVHHAKLAGLAAVRLSDDLGVPVEAREAMEFAVLGALSQDNVPITLPQITGATNPSRAGTWAFP